MNVVRAKPGSTTRFAIDLNHPPGYKQWVLIGNFHTHPGEGITQYPDPSDADLAIAVERGMPGFIKSGNHVTPYGPNRRTAGWIDRNYAGTFFIANSGGYPYTAASPGFHKVTPKLPGCP